ncbi:hypothetical protein C8R47DRAFT_1087750 [Mycena vitilis]|nr:hypothetical protein C8R47DRAFT_1087750 [Mycena vitilis]
MRVCSILSCHRLTLGSTSYISARAELNHTHSSPTTVICLPPRSKNLTLSYDYSLTMCFRQPLRDRCNVFLRVSTDRMPTSTKSKLPANLSSSAGNTPPTIPADRRSRMSPPPPLPLSPFILVDLPEEETAPRQFIPYVYLSSPSSPTTLPAGDWTHAIRVLPASKEHRAGSTSLTEATAGSTQILNLYMPANGSKNSTGLPLPRRHILVARDFLALALPYYSSAHPAEDFTGPDSPLALDPCLFPPPAQRCRTDAVRVLLVGPPRALLAIAVTYIAYASECPVAHVMHCVVDEAEDTESCEVLGEDAKMGLGAQDMQILEDLAKKGL